MRKEIDFLAKIDTSEFDKAIEQIQRKVREAYRPGEAMQQQRNTSQRLENIGLGGNMSKPTNDAYNKAMVSARKEMDQLIAKEAKSQESIAKQLSAQVKSVNDLKSAQKGLLEGSEKELALRKEIAAKEEEMYKTREQYKQKDENLNQTIDARQKLNRGGFGGMADAVKEGGFGGLAQNLSMTKMGLAGGIIGGIGSALQFGAATIDQLGGARSRTKLNVGSAIEGTVGRRINDMGNAYGQSWQNENKNAFNEASSIDDRSRLTDKLRTGGGAVSAIGSGIGLATSGIGTIPGIALAVSGLYSMLGSDRAKALTSSNVLTGVGTSLNTHTGGNNFGVGNWLKSQGDDQMKEYNSILAKEFATNFQKQLEAEQQTNPLKKLAAQDYGDNHQQYLNSQRAMGMNYDSFHGPGGFREQAINNGFSDKQAMGMSNEILGAGGSTRSARENSVFGLQMQRSGMTNAGQILGSLSGSMGDAGQSKDATIKILAEGMKLGLDDSKFAEENRRFSQTVAEIVAGTGARQGKDVDAVTGGFSRFVTDNTGKGLEGAKTAYEQYQQSSTETTGPRGIMRASAFLSNPVLSKLSTISKTALMQIPEEDFNEENVQVRAAAHQAGVSVDELRDIVVNKVNKPSQSRLPETDEARDKLRSYMKTNGISTMNDEEYKKLAAPERDSVDLMALNRGAERGTLRTQGDKSALYGDINGDLSADTPAMKKAREDAQNKKVTGSDTGRIEDQTNANMAESSRLALDSFRTFSKEMLPTVETIRQFNAQIVKTVEGLKSLSGENKNKATAGLANIIGVRSGETQPHGSKGEN